jgi:hypothetical protein
MLLNGCAHPIGSVYFWRWLPGTTSAPLLLVASILLMRRTPSSLAPPPLEPMET